jgi:hypothetical protein
MKYLITLLIATLSLNAFSQSDGWEYPFPYNPDGNSDGYIGLNDLLDLLAIYGQEFGPDQLFYTETDAILDLGPMYYGECVFQCSQLQGDWKVADIEGIGKFRDDLQNTSWYWIDLETNGAKLPIIRANDLYTGFTNSDHISNYNCACLTRAQPAIEYSLCYYETYSGLLFCVEEKLSDGWNLLGGVSRGGNSGLIINLQAFWRWVE